MEEISLSVSVIIRNRNEAAYLPRVFQALGMQDYPALEIIFVDNESTDNSVDIAGQYGAKILSLEKNSFTYGKALNMGVKEAKGDLCLILSAHSMLLGTHFISDCLSPFADENMAAVRCMYAGKTTDILNVMNPEIISDPHDIPKIIYKGPLASGCMIRRSVWEKIPFNEELLAAEEKIWALEVIKSGYKTFASCPAAYLYLKHIPPVKNLQKSYKEIVAVYKYTGFRIGFGNETPVKSMLFFLFAFLKPAPLAYFREIQIAFLTTWYTLLLGKNANKKPQQFPFNAEKEDKA